MKLYYTKPFLQALEYAPEQVKKAFRKQARFLKGNLRHPSLHAKKYDEAEGIWQARVDYTWRFYFTIESDTYYILDIIMHPK